MLSKEGADVRAVLIIESRCLAPWSDSICRVYLRTESPRLLAGCRFGEWNRSFKIPDKKFHLIHDACATVSLRNVREVVRSVKTSVD